MELANRYAELPDVDRVIMLIGPHDRDGITRNDSMEIFKLLNTNTKIDRQLIEFGKNILFDARHFS